MYTFPTALFGSRSIKAELIGASVGGGASLSGLTQSAATTGGGFWSLEMGQFPLFTPALFKVFRSIVQLSGGGAVPFIVPVCDRNNQPFLPGDFNRAPGAGFSDDTIFQDGALWTAEYITAAIVGSAPLRATTLAITITGAAALQGGEYFTIWHTARGQRLYQVIGVETQVAGTSATIDIRPPLRQATLNGQQLDFDNPRCQMHIVGSAAATLELLRAGMSPALRFAEDFLPVGS